MTQIPSEQPILLGPVVVLCSMVALVFAVVLRVVSNKFPGKYPPIYEGIPFIGGVLKFLKPADMMNSGYERFGQVFTVPLATRRFTFLLGPEVTAHFFKSTDELMSQDEVYGYCIPIFGRRVVFDASYKVRGEQLKLFADALKAEKLKRYVPQIVMEADDYVTKSLTRSDGSVQLNTFFSELVLQTASRTLLGREVRENMFVQVSHLFHELDQGMQPISVVAPYLPIPAHFRRDRARQEVAEMFRKIIRNRRENNIREDDIPQIFIDGRYEKTNGGRQLDEEEVTGMLIAGLFAGQHTSNITSTWTLLYLSKYKDYCQRVLEEQRAVIAKHGPELSYDAVRDMPVLHNCITEVLRMHPPLILLLRYCKKAFTVTTKEGKQYVIPKGDIVATSPLFAGQLEHVFTKPNVFDPDRFSDERKEDRQTMFGYIAFGGGRHACMGAAFAYVQIKTVISLLLRRFEFELTGDIPPTDFSSMVVGPEPVAVQYKRRKVEIGAD